MLIAGALITGIAATITGKAMKRALAARAAGTTTTKPTEGEKPIVGKEKPTHKVEKTTATGKHYNKLVRLRRSSAAPTWRSSPGRSSSARRSWSVS